MVSIRIGVSGWTYAPWRGDFYPSGLAHRRELEYAANQFGTIEVNGTFYSLQRPTSFATWRAQTPEDMVFALKGGRFITHLKKLREVETPLANFFASGVLNLGPKLGPILWQLPPTLAYDEVRMRDFFDLLPRTTTDAARLAQRHDERLTEDRATVSTELDAPLRHAVEVRHPSFANESVAGLFREHDVAIVVADTAGKWPFIDEATSDFVYARLHGDEKLYVSGYTASALDRWADKALAWQAAGLDVFVYFDNDVKVRAPYDALALTKRCRATTPGGRVATS